MVRKVSVLKLQERTAVTALKDYNSVQTRDNALVSSSSSGSNGSGSGSGSGSSTAVD